MISITMYSTELKSCFHALPIKNSILEGSTTLNQYNQYKRRESNPGWRLRDIQRWSALIQKNFRSVSALFITWKSKDSAETALIQRWFSLKQSLTALIFSETALKHQIFRAKNQRWIKAATALIFSETELITAKVFWNSSYHSWFSLRQRWTSLNSVSSNSCPHRIFLQFFSTKT